ncbi:MAG TPA: asparagine synthase (glutamine-hydrolyzing) [Bacteroidia bacterium]|nr:asparagine synthase (glutamine-hydrolyzing) [Bacteroidia bacterium]
MCGISGIAGFSSQQDILEAAVKMNAAIRHRGPDGEGFLVVSENETVSCFSSDTPAEIISSSFPHSPKKNISEQKNAAKIVLAHRRLAIIDTSPAGHQPLCSADGNTWITYNGEVYNYIELRTELEQHGYTFRTRTDTEVILAAYDKWGKSCCEKFNGMWAFVIWDSRKKMLFGSRDRFGVKPFYYYHDKNVFTFASEQKALLKNPFVQTSLSEVAVADYFVAGEIEYREESFFRNILELFPGCAFTLGTESGAFTQWQWFSPEEQEEEANYTEAQYAKFIGETRELLTEAVRLRMRSDVPVGSCLSGGIDSSAISGIIGDMISRHEKINVGERLKLFTAVFDDAEIDERKWAAEMVSRTGAEWFTVTPEPGELVRDIEELIFSQDVPIWSTSTYAQHRVMKLVRDNGIRVVLDGQGGDELFAGYKPYFIPFWNELRSAGQTGILAAEKNAFGLHEAKLYNRRERLKQVTFPSLPLSLRLLVQKNYFPDIAYLDKALISVYKKNYRPVSPPKTLNEALRGEFVNTRLKGYLKCEDRCSMWHSVESRTPFADDHKLIGRVFRIPGTMKIRNATTKYLLREAAAPFIPDSIRNRKDKLGYATPNNKWITQLRDQFRPYFEQDFGGILKKEKLLKDFDTFFSVEGMPENGRTFRFIAFAVWKKVTGL